MLFTHLVIVRIKRLTGTSDVRGNVINIVGLLVW